MSENTEIEDGGNATQKAQGDPSGGSGLGATPCSVCLDVLRRIGGHDCSRLDGEHGLAAATMRSHEALLRVCDLVELWERTLQNRNGITWSEMDAGDTIRLRKSIDEVKAAINSPNSEEHLRA